MNGGIVDIATTYQDNSIVKSLQLSEGDMAAEGHITNEVAVWQFSYSAQVVHTILQQQGTSV